MTKEETKIFFELPKEERERFKRESWKRRNPAPETEDNKVESQYYNRL
jgi:GWxTD domain-containing protein